MRKPACGREIRRLQGLRSHICWRFLTAWRPIANGWCRGAELVDSLRLMRLNLLKNQRAKYAPFSKVAGSLYTNCTWPRPRSMSHHLVIDDFDEPNESCDTN